MVATRLSTSMMQTRRSSAVRASDAPQGKLLGEDKTLDGIGIVGGRAPMTRTAKITSEYAGRRAIELYAAIGSRRSKPVSGGYTSARYVGVALSQRVTDAFLRTGRRWSVACGFAVGLVALLLDPDGKQNEQAASVLTGHERPQPGLSVSQALSEATQGTARASCRHGSGSTARAVRG